MVIFRQKEGAFNENHYLCNQINTFLYYIIMTIQEIIEEKIRRAGKTKTSVCADIGINSGNLNRMLSSPSWPTLERIAGALGLSVAALLTSPDEEAQRANVQPMQIVEHVRREVPQRVVCPHCGVAIELEVKVKSLF